MQNTSHAVMSQRIEAKDAPDDFPTPPWASRALIEQVLDKHTIYDKKALSLQSCLEPACGRGHMAQPLKEYFGLVKCSDAHDYGYGDVQDFLTRPQSDPTVDWVITNPPFRLAEEFIIQGLKIARFGVAILARTVFLESAGRYNTIFLNTPPTIFAPFVERVPMVRGRVDKNASTATSYAWFIWHQHKTVDGPYLRWIPPCRRRLERENDYLNPIGHPLT